MSMASSLQSPVRGLQSAVCNPPSLARQSLGRRGVRCQFLRRLGPVSGNALLNGDTPELPSDAESAEFIEQRIENLRRFQSRAQKMWNSPIVQRLLK